MCIGGPTSCPRSTSSSRGSRLPYTSRAVDGGASACGSAHWSLTAERSLTGPQPLLPWSVVVPEGDTDTSLALSDEKARMLAMGNTGGCEFKYLQGKGSAREDARGNHTRIMLHVYSSLPSMNGFSSHPVPCGMDSASLPLQHLLLHPTFVALRPPSSTHKQRERRPLGICAIR